MFSGRTFRSDITLVSSRTRKEKFGRGQSEGLACLGGIF